MLELKDCINAGGFKTIVPYSEFLKRGEEEGSKQMIKGINIPDWLSDNDG